MPFSLLFAAQAATESPGENRCRPGEPSLRPFKMLKSRMCSQTAIGSRLRPSQPNSRWLRPPSMETRVPAVLYHNWAWLSSIRLRSMEVDAFHSEIGAAEHMVTNGVRRRQSRGRGRLRVGGSLDLTDSQVPLVSPPALRAHDESTRKEPRQYERRGSHQLSSTLQSESRIRCPVVRARPESGANCRRR
jgi:hypothetical protein